MKGIYYQDDSGSGTQLVPDDYVLEPGQRWVTDPNLLAAMQGVQANYHPITETEKWVAPDERMLAAQSYSDDYMHYQQEMYPNSERVYRTQSDPYADDYMHYAPIDAYSQPIYRVPALYPISPPPAVDGSSYRAQIAPQVPLKPVYTDQYGQPLEAQKAEQILASQGKDAYGQPVQINVGSSVAGAGFGGVGLSYGFPTDYQGKPRLVMAGYNPMENQIAKLILDYQEKILAKTGGSAGNNINFLKNMVTAGGQKVWELLNPEEKMAAEMKYILSGGAYQNLIDRQDMVWQISRSLGQDPKVIEGAVNKLLAAGSSGLLMALTGNFPVAAMGYFAIDRILGQNAQGKPEFNGVLNQGGTLDGMPLLRSGLRVPDGLPNDIFDKYRFICFDRLTDRWYPSDELQPLNNSGEPFRYLCLDRLDSKVYRANLIRAPRIYL